ncbi:tyrosine-type recombinase/integrase [Draconibacterium mangrovi]|uniref:tyrosine-type recombinase/integrase n=1 Tax=Draconibacterium mangrovi TaxID=2697469 RepID=UPI0013D688A1|nr:site-specific integrase [Draconibacterium mangrovi]
MATVKLKLNKNYKSKDEKNNSYPLVFVIGNRSTHAHISTEIKLPEEYWDPVKLIKKGAPGIDNPSFQNTQLATKLSDLYTFINKLSTTGEINALSAAQIKAKYQSSKIKEKYDFYTYFEYYITTKGESTATIYKRTYKILQNFNSSRLSFSDVNARFLRDFTSWHDKSTNGTAIHLRNIRAVFNAAIDDDVIGLELYPFRRFKIPKAKTRKRNITAGQIKTFKDAELYGVPHLARDVFMLQFYLIGINLKDLTYLKKSSVKRGRLEYTRMKTGTEYSIKLEPEAKRLIKKLSGKKYLICLAERYQNYDSIKKEINKKLKAAAKSVKIQEPLSTYYSRHSWATIAHKLNIPEDTIAAALGHQSAHKITSIYIERDISKVDNANRKVLNAIK